MSASGGLVWSVWDAFGGLAIAVAAAAWEVCLVWPGARAAAARRRGWPLWLHIPLAVCACGLAAGAVVLWHRLRGGGPGQLDPLVPALVVIMWIMASAPIWRPASLGQLAARTLLYAGIVYAATTSRLPAPVPSLAPDPFGVWDDRMVFACFALIVGFGGALMSARPPFTVFDVLP